MGFAASLFLMRNSGLIFCILFLVSGCSVLGPKEAKTPHDQRLSCDRGKASDCLKLARKAQASSDGLTESILYARKSCERSSIKGCGFLAEVLSQAGDLAGADEARARAARLRSIKKTRIE